MVLITGIVNGFGELATATFGAVSRIDQIAFMPAMTLGMAISTLAGQNLGAGHFHRVKEIFKWGCIFSGGITVVISLIAVSMSRILLQAFVSDPTVLDMGTQYLHIVGSCYIFFSLVFVSNGIINGAGATIITTLVSLLSLWIIRVPVAYYLSGHLQSVNGIWYAISLSFFFSMVASQIYYFSGRWRKAAGKRYTPAKEAEAEVELYVQHVTES
jgi:Na+-driven multidrug efflux pump